MDKPKGLDVTRNFAVILVSGHTLIGKFIEVLPESLVIAPEDDPEGLILIPWASVLYVQQEGPAKEVPHG